MKKQKPQKLTLTDMRLLLEKDFPKEKEKEKMIETPEEKTLAQ